MVTKKSPIGVFDSGMGGLSIVKEIKKIMPNEDIVYFGDSGNAPYGTKNVEEVIDLTEKAFDFLVSKGVKAIVIACNTATSAAAKYLREKYSFSIIGMEPALKPAVLMNKGNKIVVMATPMTLKEEKFKKLMENYEEKCLIVKMPAPRLVEYVESGMEDQRSLNDLFDKYFSELDKNLIDSVVLGCTHFLFVKDKLASYFDSKVDIFDGNEGTVKHLKNTLMESKLLNNIDNIGTVTVYNSGNAKEFETTSKLLNDVEFCFRHISE